MRESLRPASVAFELLSIPMRGWDTPPEGSEPISGDLTMFKRLIRCASVFAVLGIAGTSVFLTAAAAQQEERRQDERRQTDRSQQDRRDRQDDRRGGVQEERRTTEQDRRDTVQDDRRGADQGRTPQEYRVKNILGTKVSIQGDISIGTVDDIVFSDDGYVEYLIVNNEGQMRTVPWAAAKFNFERKTATVNITQSQYQSVPTFTADRYPTFFAPAYRQEIYRFYGLTPRDMRRFDRR